MSLLEYTIHCIRKHNPNILKFTSELVACEMASKIEVSILTQKVQELERGVEKIKKELAKNEDLINTCRDDIEKCTDEA